MNRHLSDADLVALALLPDEEPDVRLHLASCASCSERMHRATAELDLQRRTHERAVESRDATFWKRQELAIMREVSRSGRPAAAARRSFIAAALVAMALGGFWFGRTTIDHESSPVTETVAQTTPAPSSRVDLVPTASVPTDPWESDTLSEFQAVVDWESWVEDNGKGEGTI